MIAEFCRPIFCLCICCKETFIQSNYTYFQKLPPPTPTLTISVPEYIRRVKNFGNFLSMSAINVICFPLFLRNAVFWMASISPTARPIWEEMAQKMMIIFLFLKKSKVHWETQAKISGRWEFLWGYLICDIHFWGKLSWIQIAIIDIRHLWLFDGMEDNKGFFLFKNDQRRFRDFEIDSKVPRSESYPGTICRSCWS